MTITGRIFSADPLDSVYVIPGLLTLMETPESFSGFCQRPYPEADFRGLLALCSPGRLLLNPLQLTPSADKGFAKREAFQFLQEQSSNIGPHSAACLPNRKEYCCIEYVHIHNCSVLVQLIPLKLDFKH